MGASPSPRSFLVVALGSFGDVHPKLGIARALQRRGHDVEVIANPLYQAVVERAGLPFTPLGSEDEFLRATEDPRMWRPTQGMKVLGGEVILPYMRPLFELIEQRMGEGLVVAAPVTAFGARLAQEKLGVKLATINLQPATFRSAVDVPGLPFTPRPKLFLPLAKLMHRIAYWTADTFFFDPVLRAPFNRLRSELGLAPVKHPFAEWMLSTDLAIGLFPEWFGMPQPDWPRQARCTQFPLFDESDQRERDARLEEFLGAGDPPIVFTPGTAMRHAQRFFATSVEACRRLGKRGVLLTRFPEQLPADLPRGVVHFDYAPLSRVLPRSAALVYHGGIGTASQALAAGVPQLVVPFSYDQPDNGARLERLGVARMIWQALYSPGRAARALSELLRSAQIAEACRKCADLIAEADPTEQACELIEGL